MTKNENQHAVRWQTLHVHEVRHSHAPERVLALAIACAALFAGCGGSPDETSAPASSASSQMTKVAAIDLAQVADGTYTGESSENDEYGHGKLSITVQDHKITAATYFGIDKEGVMKGADYGKASDNPGAYKKAQTAVQANATYAQELVKRQQPADVDAISGATISYQQFQEACGKAFAAAK